MAEGKNKVIWYADWRDLIRDLNGIQKAKFIEWFSAYVADENPHEPKGDPDLYAVIFHVKIFLKRDLKKWEQKTETNRINGAKGGRPKKTQKNPKNPTVISKPKKGDNDNDNDNDIKKTPSVLKKTDAGKKLFMQLKSELETGTTWMERFAMDAKLKPDVWPQIFKEFAIHYAAREKSARNYSDLKDHLRNWVTHPSTKSKHPKFYR